MRIQVRLSSQVIFKSRVNLLLLDTGSYKHVSTLTMSFSCLECIPVENGVWGDKGAIMVHVRASSIHRVWCGLHCLNKQNIKKER